MYSFIKADKFWTPTRLALSLITFALMAGMGFSNCSAPAPDASNGNNNSSKTNTGQPSSTATSSNPNSAPPVTAPLPTSVMNTEMTALDGTTFKLADYKGNVVLVNLWATWCGPCRSEIPDLIKVSQEFKARGVEVIGLTSEDPETDAVKVRDFVREFGITYKIGWGDQSIAMALMQGQVRNTIPQSFVISRDGRVVKRFVGFNANQTPPKLRLALEEALNQY